MYMNILTKLVEQIFKKKKRHRLKGLIFNMKANFVNKLLVYLPNVINKERKNDRLYQL